MVSQTNKPIDAYIDLKAVKKMYNISTLDVRLKNSI